MNAVTPGSAFSDYRLAIKGRRGMPIKPLRFGADPTPFPDESLLGVVARTMACNGFVDLNRIGRFADRCGCLANTLPSIDDVLAQRLAFVLRLPPREVIDRLHRPVVRPEMRGEFIDFFGVPLRAAYREGEWRRVSPRALGARPSNGFTDGDRG